jgi:hypothetical protein
MKEFMKETKYWNRYYRYVNGVKVIQKFNKDIDPNKTTEHTDWVRGTGPLSSELLNRLSEINRRHWTNKPKSLEQRQKMADASKGRKKSETHRESLRKAWETRRIRESGNSTTSETNA